MDLDKIPDKEHISNMTQNNIFIARQMEMTRRLKDSIEKVNKSIISFDKNSSKQNTTVIKLTKWIIILTISIGVLTLIQAIKMFF